MHFRALAASLLFSLACPGPAQPADSGQTDAFFASPGLHYFSGECSTRTLAFKNTSSLPKTIDIAWSMVTAGAAVSKGESSFSPPPQGEIRCAPAFVFPEVQRRVNVRVKISLTESFPSSSTAANKTSGWETEWLVYPRQPDLPWKFLEKAKVGVWDPAGRIAPLLAGYGGKPERVRDAEEAAAYDGDLLLIGENAFRDPGEFAECMAKIGKRNKAPGVVALPQKSIPALKNPVSVTRGTSSSPAPFPPFGLRIEKGNSLFAGLDARDFAGWRAPASPLRPIAPARTEFPGRFLIRLENDPSAGLLQELFPPSGRRVYLCQIPLLELWDREPVSAIFFNQLLRHALTEAKAPIAWRLSICGDSDLEPSRRIAEAFSARWDDTDARDAEAKAKNILSSNLPAGAPDALVILDASPDSLDGLRKKNPDFQKRLENFVTGGGTLIVAGLKDEDLKPFEWALGRDAAIKSAPLLPPSAPADSPLLCGIGTEWTSLGTLSSLQPAESVEREDLLKPGIVVRIKQGTGNLYFVQADFSKASREAINLTLGQFTANLSVK